MNSGTTDELPESLETYRKKLHDLSDKFDLNELKNNRDEAEDFLQELRETRPLSVTIPREYDGDGIITKNILTLLEITSYVSLPFSLLFGINGALFLQPIAKHGTESLKDEILGGFLDENRLGGLMVTEPGHGTDALKMRTQFSRSDDSTHVSGLKHWAGLTGWADHWIIAARNEQKDGSLGRDISLFICNKEEVDVEEYFANLGLTVLPYGRNKISADPVPNRQLQPDGSGIRMMQDFFHRSRLQFPGMAMGYLRRIRDEAYEHCHSREVGGQQLEDYENVSRQLRNLDAFCTICSAMCVHTSENLTLDKNVSNEIITANSIKAFVTDIMQIAADTYLQLSGADGYRSDHRAGQAYVDSRPFQIFEGPNDVLYNQVGQKVLKESKKSSADTYYDYLEENSEFFIPYDALELNFSLNEEFSQSQQVLLGKITSRILTMTFCNSLSDREYPSDRLEACQSYLNSEVQSLTDRLKRAEPVQKPELNNSLDGKWTKFVN